MSDTNDEGEINGRLSEARARVRRVRDGAAERLDATRLVVPATDLVLECGRRYRRLNGSVLIGHLTYRLFLWLVPFILVVVSLLGIGLEESTQVEELLDQSGLGATLTESIAEQSSVSRSYALTIGLFGLLFATWSLIRALYYVFAQVWELEIRPPSRGLRAVGWALGSSLVVLALFAAVALSRNGGLVVRLGGRAGALALNAGLLFALSWFLPRRTRSWLELLPGVAAAALGMLLLQLFAQLWLPNKLENSSALYGGIGGAFATLLYLWLLANLLILSAFLNSVWVDRGTLLRGRPLIADPDRLPRPLRPPVNWVTNAWRRWVPGAGSDGE